MNEIQKERLTKVLGQHEGENADVIFWTSRFELMPFDIVDHILEFFELMPGEMSWLRGIQERKETALLQGSREVWQDIVQEEQTRLASLSIK